MLQDWKFHPFVDAALQAARQHLPSLQHAIDSQCDTSGIIKSSIFFAISL